MVVIGIPVVVESMAWMLETVSLFPVFFPLLPASLSLSPLMCPISSLLLLLSFTVSSSLDKSITNTLLRDVDNDGGCRRKDDDGATFSMSALSVASSSFLLIPDSATRATNAEDGARVVECALECASGGRHSGISG